MKKMVTALLLACIMMMAILPVTSFAKTGDIIGYAKYTDISAYINHYPITSYNINDYTAIVAEDLANYGFNVVWNEYERALYIGRNDYATEITPYGTVQSNAALAGQYSFPYLETDIKTYVNGAWVESFNINGKTCIYIDSLAACGEVVWVPEVRAIKLWLAGLPIQDYAPLSEPSQVAPASVVEYSGVGDKVITNVNIPFGSHYAELTHNGKSNFITKLYYGEKSYDYFLLSNEIGVCSLQVAMNENANAAIKNGMIEVKADGAWTIKIKPVSGTTTTNIKGNGRVVTGIFTAKSSRVAVNMTHSGSRNFITKVIKYNGTKSYDYELLSNEIGNYSGQKVITLTPGTQYYFYVRADGNWTIDFGEGDSVTSYIAP